MKCVHIASLIFLLGITCIYNRLDAETPAPFSPRMEKILKANPEMSVFPLDKELRPAPDKNESKQEYQTKFKEFLDIQQESAREVTETQKQQLLHILLDPQSYSHPPTYSVRDSNNIGIILKTSENSAALFCGSHGICASYEDTKNAEFAMFSAEGEKAFKQWRDGIALSNPRSFALPLSRNVHLNWKDGVLISASGLPEGATVKDPHSENMWIVGHDGKVKLITREELKNIDTQGSELAGTEVNHLARISDCIELYAADHGGKFPDKLENAFPDNLDKNVRQFTDPQTHKAVDWIYYPGHASFDLDKETILASSPVFIGRKGKTRIILLLDLSVLQVGEEDFETRLQNQKHHGNSDS